VFNDLKTRGVNDILIAVVDGLKGLAEAIETALPQTTVQTCIVHLIRNSLSYASWKDRKAVAKALRPIYAAPTAEAAEAALAAFATGPWGQKYQTIAPAWAGLGARDPVFRIPAGGAACDLYHQRDREPAQSAQEDHQDPRTLPERRCGPEAAMAGALQCPRRTGTISEGMERGDEPVRHPLRRPVHSGGRVNPASHTKFLTGPILSPLGISEVETKIIPKLDQLQ
jgi:hypothetical protein